MATRGLQGVEFLGRVSDAEKAQLFRTADVYVSPATGGESFGIVLLEAMAAGTPIVCSDIHGYKGVVRRGREGLLVPPRDPKELAERHRPAAATTRSLRDRMGAAGQARAEEFSWPRVTAKVEEYYGFVIRRLAASGSLPSGFRRRDPSGAATAPGEAVVRIVRSRTDAAVAAWTRRMREPPDRRRVGHHQAGHPDGHGEDRRASA